MDPVPAGTDVTIDIKMISEGTYKLCYRANGLMDSTKQSGIILYVQESTTTVISTTSTTSTTTTSTTTNDETTKTSSTTTTTSTSTTTTSTSTTLTVTAYLSVPQAVEASVETEKSLVDEISGAPSGAAPVTKSFAGGSSVGVVLTDTQETTVSPSQHVAVKIPASVTEQFSEPAAVVVTEFLPNASQVFDQPDKGMTVASPTIVINLYSLQSKQQLLAENLQEEITFTLSDSPPGDAKCAYWDEAEQRWSPRGVTTFTNAQGGTECRTTHLSIFGAIVNKFTCANHVIFTQEAVEHTIDTLKENSQWKFVVVFAFLLVQIIFLCLAKAADKRDHLKSRWKDEFFLTTNVAFCVVAADHVNSQSALEAAKQQSQAAGHDVATAAEDVGADLCLTMGLACLCKRMKRMVSPIKKLCMAIHDILKEVGMGCCMCNREAMSKLLTAFCIWVVKTSAPYGLGAKRGLACESVDMLVVHQQAEEKTEKKLQKQLSEIGEVEERSMSAIAGTDEDNPNLAGDRENASKKVLPSTPSTSVGPSASVGLGGATSTPSASSFATSSSNLPTLRSTTHLGENPESSLHNFFLRSCLCTRIVTFFAMREQWCELFFFNASCPRAERQLLIAIDLLMNFCIVALWFEASGTAYSPDDTLDWREVEKCQPLDMWYSLVVGVVFAFVYKIVLYAPMGLLRGLLSKEFVYDSEWTEAKCRKTLRCWRIKTWIFWFFGLLWVLGCSSFLLMFWANIADDIQRDFALGSGNYLIQYYFLDSFVLAVLFGLFTAIAVWLRPNVVKETVAEYVHATEEDEEDGAKEKKLEDAPAQSEQVLPPVPPKKEGSPEKKYSKQSLPKPSLKTEGEKLIVNWLVPDASPPISCSSVSVRIAGASTWQLVDFSGGKHVLVDRGGNPIPVPTSSIAISVIDQVRSTAKGSVVFQARVSMMDADGWGPWSAPSDTLEFEATPIRVGDTVEVLPGKALLKEGKDYYKEGDIGRVKDIYMNFSGESKMNITWERTGLESSVSKSTWQERFKLIAVGDLQSSMQMSNVPLEMRDEKQEDAKTPVRKSPVLAGPASKNSSSSLEEVDLDVLLAAQSNKKEEARLTLLAAPPTPVVDSNLVSCCSSPRGDDMDSRGEEPTTFV